MAQKRRRASRRAKNSTRRRAKCNTLRSKKILDRVRESQFTRAFKSIRSFEASLNQHLSRKARTSTSKRRADKAKNTRRTSRLPRKCWQI